MFLQTGGGGKGIRPNQQHQPQHHHQTHLQTHHNHHPHPAQQQQAPSVHHGHTTPQQNHSHHPHQQHQHQHSHQQQQSQQQQQQQQSQHHHPPPPIAYYSYQLSQAQPPPSGQHLQAANNAAVTSTQMAPSPPTQANTVGATSAGSATQSHTLVGGVSGGMSGGGGVVGVGNVSGSNNTSATNIARQHAAAAAATVNSGANMQHYTTGTALMQTPPTSTAFMTTTYLQQYQLAAAAAAAQYNNNAAVAAAAAANNHNGPGSTQQTATSMYQQQQQQHHQALHHTQTQMQAHYYTGAGATPTPPPPHLHPHHHAQQHQLRGVLTATPHQRQPQTTYLLPANTIFALPPGPLGTAPRTSLLAASTHQQTANTAGGMSVSPLLQSGTRASVGGPTAYITAPFCQPPLPMGAAGLTPPQPLLATPSAMAQQTLQTYGHLTGAAAASNSSSTTSLSIGAGGGISSGVSGGTNTGTGTETVKPRKHAIPIIHPITHENILDPKPQKKSTAVEVKPSYTEIVSGTQESTASSVREPTDKSITVSISKTQMSTYTGNAETMEQEMCTENIPIESDDCNAPLVLVQSSMSKEKIDQQMQTDAVHDRSSYRRVGTYDMPATDCSAPISAIPADEDSENFAYVGLEASDSHIDCNEGLNAYEEDQQLSLGDEQSAELHATASLHSATGDDGEDSVYDEASTSLMDIVENEEENSITLEVYDEQQNMPHQQHLLIHDSEGDEMMMQNRFEATDIDVVSSVATLSGEKDHIEDSTIYQQPEQSYSETVAVLPAQTASIANSMQNENETTTTVADNDYLQTSADADSVMVMSSVGLTETSAQTATYDAKAQLTSSKSITSASSESVAASSVTNICAPTMIVPTGKSSIQKPSPNNSGASSLATSTPSHHAYTQPQQTQRQQQQPAQQHTQLQQRKAASALSNVHNTMASTGGASSTSCGSSISQSVNSVANTKKNRKSKRSKESQKKLNKQADANSQRSGTTTQSSNNSNNNNNSGNNNNNNKNTLNNANNNNLNNNLATKSMTTTTATTTTNILTDKNNANSLSDSGNLEDSTSTANFVQQHQLPKQQRSGSVTKTNTKSDSLTDVHQADRTSPTPTSQLQQKPTKHLKSQEIEAQFMKQLEPPPQLQFLNSSSSACEEEEEMSARIQMQLEQDAADAAKSFSDLKFGEFGEDKDSEDLISTTFDTNQDQSTKSHASQDQQHIKHQADTTNDTVDSTVNMSKTQLSRSSSTVGSRIGQKSSTIASTNTINIDEVEPLKARKYSMDELKALSNSSEARKPPMVACQRGDFISQLFVSRQQHHLMHHAHNIPILHQHLQQQQYQQMNFNESMELVSGKRGRSGQTKKHHDHQSSGTGISGVLSVAAASGSGGSGAGAGGIGNIGGALSAQQQRKVDFIRVQLSLKDEIKLSECANAWQPATLRSKSNNVSPSDANDDIDAVLKKVRGVLNKLTPDNFDVLLKSMTSISMNTQEKMQQVMLLIFEKTVSEPNFAPTYAKFCKILFQEIKAENKSLFNSSLINRIQQEFETNVNDANAKKLKLQPLVEKIDSCADTKERLELQAELEDQEYQFRRRAWGTVRFIGEMFKLQSLTNDRVFICIESLLEHGSEEKLEYMCKLLTTVGHLLESPENTGNARMDKIFRKIQDIIHKSRSSNKSSAANSHYKISSRVRFMMQDVMDLRSRTWDHPRATLTQSHQQQLQQQMMSQQQQQQQQLSNQRRTAIGGAKQDDKMSSGGIYEKNNRLGNYGGGNAGGGGGNQRHYYQKSQKSQQFMQQHEQKLNIDLNKLKFTSDEVTQSTTKLGSSHLYLWRTLGKQSASANLTTNAPATLLSINTNNNTGGGFKRQSSILGSTTQTMPSLANNPFQALDRPDSYTSGSTPPEQQNKQFAIGEESDLPDLSKNKCQKMLNSIIEELLDAGSSRSDSSDSWQQEIVNEWTSLNLRQQKTLLTYILTDYLHLRNVKRAQRKACATIFVHLMRTKVCEPETFTQVFTDLADELPDVLVDVPNMWAYVFEFIGPLLHEQLLHFNDIWLPQWAANINFTTRFLQALIQYFTSEFGATYTRELWNKEFKLEHGQRFMSDKTQWREFINTNGFQYIHDRNYKPTQSAAQSKSVHPAAIAEQVTRIEYLLNAASGCDLPIDYINTNVNINTHFIRSLTKFLCCEYATVTPSSNNAATSNDRFPSSTRLRQLDTELFHHKCIPLLRRCLDGLEIHELACLDAIVDAMQQIYDTPTANQLICSVFDLIYDSEVIPKESFDKWYRAEQQEIINAGSSNDCVGAAGGQLDSKDGAARSSGKKSLTSTVGSAGKASSGEESGVSSAGAVRLNDELHAYMEKLL